MSISFNNPLDMMTSDGKSGSLNLIVEGGTPTNPRPIRLNSSSVIMPVQDLPTGEAGAIVFDRNTLTMKYHDGNNWVELLSATDITAGLSSQITVIQNELGTKVDKVTYTSSSVPTAAISGSTLNIVFPIPGAQQGGTGLYTSSKPGSIMHYSLTSGQTVASIREQMSGSVNGQSGRNGTQSSPWKTSDGWCFADGMWWTWEGANGTVTKQIPNLNQNAYLKGITTSGITKTDATIASSASLGNYTFDIPEHYHGTGMLLGSTGSDGDDAAFISGKTWNDGTSYRGVGVFGSKNGRFEFAVNGNNANTALGTTKAIYSKANSTTITHTHAISDLDVTHFNVAVLYNIAEPSTALSEKVANDRYVKKTGDTMSGTLSIANTASITGDGTNLQLYFRASGGGERAAIYHQSSTSTLRLRSNGGSEFVIANNGTITVSGDATINGKATVGGKNVVRSVNGNNADSSGNVTVSLQGNYVSAIRMGDKINVGVADNRFIPGYVINGWANGNKKELRGGGYWTAPLQYLVGSTWILVSNLS